MSQVRDRSGDGAAVERCARPILLVDDDDDVRMLVRRAIEASGTHPIFGVKNGKEALDFLYSVEALPCMILLDLMMPILDGWEVLSILRSHDGFRSIPVAVITAVADLGGLAGLHSGPVLPKPLSLRELYETVNGLCQKSGRAPS